MKLLLLLACGPAPEAIATGISSDNPTVRQDMVVAAKLVDDPVVIEALIGALEDDSTVIRVSAIESLADLSAVEAVPAICERLDDDEEGVRRAAVDALGRLQDPGGTEALIEYLDEHRAGRVPLNALWALGNIGDPAALPILSRFREHEDPYVAYNADLALRAIGDAEFDAEEPLPEAPIEEPEVFEEPAVEEPPPKEAPVKRNIPFPG
ncbi:MAG TPA: HEAT repeat domain-containing protein [Myxococcota bacterium]|nr:HEAT repeat domain-containing protein [Myxococcota bacterium]